MSARRLGPLVAAAAVTLGVLGTASPAQAHFCEAYGTDPLTYIVTGAACIPHNTQHDVEAEIAETKQEVEWAVDTLLFLVGCALDPDNCFP